MKLSRDLTPVTNYICSCHICKHISKHSERVNYIKKWLAKSIVKGLWRYIHSNILCFIANIRFTILCKCVFCKYWLYELCSSTVTWRHITIIPCCIIRVTSVFLYVSGVNLLTCNSLALNKRTVTMNLYGLNTEVIA